MRVLTIPLTLLLVLLFCTPLFADDNSRQSNREAILEGTPAQNIKPTYTLENGDIVLRYFDPDEDPAQVFTTGAGGFVHGYNGYFDFAKATGFVLPNGMTEGKLKEVRIWWGIKSDDVNDQTFDLQILEGFGDVDWGPDPDADPIYTTSHPLSEINADSDGTTNLGVTVYTLNSPVTVPSLFYVSTFFGEYEADEWLAAIFSTQRDQRVEEDWEQWDDGGWRNMSDAWGANWNMWIEAVIEGEEVVDDDELVLRYFDPDEDPAQVFTTGAGGFVHGYNGYFDFAKATGFVLPNGMTEATLKEVRIWWGIKSDDVNDQTFDLQILEGFGDVDWGPDPDADPIYSASHPLSEINADSDPETNLGVTVYTLNSPVTVPSLFYVSTFFGEYEADEWLAAIFSTQRDQRVEEDWEQWDDGGWRNMSDAWGANWNMWIEAVIDVEVSVPEEPGTLPRTFTLHQNYPNPFNPATIIQFSLPEQTKVTLAVYDILGRKVATLVDQVKDAGVHDVTFTPRNLSSGIYFYRLEAGDLVRTKTMHYIR